MRHSRSLERKARKEFETHGRVLMDTACRLLAMGFDVQGMERQWAAMQEREAA
jgi:hypothetical protein